MTSRVTRPLQTWVGEGESGLRIWGRSNLPGPIVACLQEYFSGGTRTGPITLGMAPRTSTSTTKKATATGTSAVTRKSRAVLRDVEAGSSVDCARCGERVKFQAKVRNKQVICNIYTSGVWNRVEHFHQACYEEAGSPYGEADASTDFRRRAANEAAAERRRKLAEDAGAATA